MLDIPLMQDNIVEEDKRALIDFLEQTDRFTQGPQVRAFEREWSEWLGCRHSVFVNSGASANLITMMALAETLGKGEIIVPAITWSSDISSVLLAGHTPVFVDIDFKNLAMDENEVLNAISERTKAVFLTHVLGFNGLTENLELELRKRGVVLIEDACESHGTRFARDGRDAKVGSVGFASNFSFYYAHHMSTVEGGMVCTDDGEFYQLVCMLRSHGMLRENPDPAVRELESARWPDLNPEFTFMMPGFNVRSSEMNAVIGRKQLPRLDNAIRQRRENCELFVENLRSDRYFTDFDLRGQSNYALVTLLREADSELFARVCEKLRSENVEFRRGTAGGGNMTRQPFVRRALPDVCPESFPHADHVHSFGLYTGNYPGLEKGKIERLCTLLNTL
ncbi:DegT/DnrJ/EryC1/StrS aminotransferase family protein [Eggerthella sp. YY7918]|uniref:DegT/DnrJ/EryC1/StrS family aminotransferase n=1 Tax=Eggerthella sp. (strain YY7918) TaxID=502558 RepID=UPI0002170FD9|nr:DegT/DnrJ/EryC1/StrS aminotransferase family protein [Eggerthella sp. YY7918]BAK43921.1 hypothetical protein EGYY_07240 [Eggerthella sp. YY7918]